ncbi:MAG TPA: hypothetical protein VLC93_09955 [Myxococcota bacterium]|nr:hypothetical protein [Myxococcota bacterium]
MSARALITLAVVLTACSADGLVPDTCQEDDECPFEQCCVQGACVDPGPVGSCATAAIANSSLVVTPSTVVAGSDADVRITVRDIHGRPIAGATAEVLISSDCLGCDSIVSGSWRTDAAGNIAAVFRSTGAGAKELRLFVGSAASPTTIINVIPDVAVSVGFTGAIADTRVDSPLGGVAVTRLDVYGNPGALPEVDRGPTAVEIQLDANPAGLVLVDAGRAALAPESRRFVLSQPSVPVEGLYVNQVSHGLRLTAFDASTEPALAASQSNAFDITAPHVTSDIAAVLSGSPASPVTLEWAVTPDVPVSLRESGAAPSRVTSPHLFYPTFSGELASVTHVRIQPEMVAPALDVEVTKLGTARTSFIPSQRAGSQVNITDIKRLGGGDLVVAGTFTFDMILGERSDGSLALVSAVITTGLEGFIARLDPTGRELRWVVIYYAQATNNRGVNVSIRDIDVGGGTITALAEFSGAAAGWRFDGPPNAAFPNGRPRQCTMGTPSTDTAITTAVARIDPATGDVDWCAGLHDPDAATGTVSDVRAGAAAVIGNAHYVAVRVTDTFRVYRGTVADGAQPVKLVDGAGAGNPVVLVVPTTESGCTPGVTSLVPLSNGALDGEWNVATTGISFDPTVLFRDADGQGFVLGGQACSNGVNDIQIGGTTSVDTAGIDSTLLRVDTPLDHEISPGGTMRLVWHSDADSTDRLFDADRFLDDIVILGDFTSTLPFGGGTLGLVSSSTTAYVARLDRLAGEIAWYSRIGSSTTAASGQGISVSGDRIVIAVQSSDDLTIVDSLHTAFDMNDAQPDPVGLLAELDNDGEVRWSSPFLGTTRTSRPLALPGGSVLLGANGLQGSIVLGPLDAQPARQANQRGGRQEPVLVIYTPYDFAVRDILRQP